MGNALYLVRKISERSADMRWDRSPWNLAEELRVEQFRPEGSDHRPITRVEMVHDGRNLHLYFLVQDRYVRAVAEKFGDRVCEDSCVEFFVQPTEGKGYFNFEMNCGGTLLVYYVEDPTRAGAGFKKYTVVTEAEASTIQIAHSMPKRVEPEITEAIDWSLRCAIPLGMMERYVGPIGPLAGQVWRGNFYKCGDKTSHPHWASWSEVDELNFHLPRCFGVIEFE